MTVYIEPRKPSPQKGMKPETHTRTWVYKGTESKIMPDKESAAAERKKGWFDSPTKALKALEKKAN